MIRIRFFGPRELKSEGFFGRTVSVSMGDDRTRPTVVGFPKQLRLKRRYSPCHRALFASIRVCRSSHAKELDSTRLDHSLGQTVSALSRLVDYHPSVALLNEVFTLVC